MRSEVIAAIGYRPRRILGFAGVSLVAGGGALILLASSLTWADAAGAAPQSGPVVLGEVPITVAAPFVPAVGDLDWATLARYDDGWARRETAGRADLGRMGTAARLDAALEPGRQAAAGLRRELETS